jgi:hypothetical protein
MKYLLPRILTITASDESIVNLSRLVARITENPQIRPNLRALSQHRER